MSAERGWIGDPQPSVEWHEAEPWWGVRPQRGYQSPFPLPVPGGRLRHPVQAVRSAALCLPSAEAAERGVSRGHAVDTNCVRLHITHVAPR